LAWYNENIILDVEQQRLNGTSGQTKTTSTLTQGYLICIVGTLIWSFTAIFIRYLTENYQLPPLVLAFWRDLFVFLTLGCVFMLFARTRLQVERRHVKFLLLYGFILSIFNSLWTFSVAINGAAVSTVLAYSSAAFTAVLGWRLFGERLGLLKILAVSLSLLGCVFVSGAYSLAAWRLNSLGIITGLLSGIAFAAYSLMGKASSQRQIYPWTTLFYTFGFGAAFLLLYNLLPAMASGSSGADLFWLGDAWLGWVVLVTLAVGPTIGGYGLYTVSLGYLPASVANLIATMEPAFTAGLAYLLLGERLSVPQLFGSALIISGVVILRLSEGRAGSEEAALAAG
jgi:drug/metabolite transporter (DMT)-like permease